MEIISTHCSSGRSYWHAPRSTIGRRSIRVLAVQTGSCHVSRCYSIPCFGFPLISWHASRRTRQCPLGHKSCTWLSAYNDGSNAAPTPSDIERMDSNQLQTALNVAIASEDYALAAQLRDALARVMGTSSNARLADWRQMGVPDWLAERADRLGFRWPTEIQKRTTAVLIDGLDCIVQSATGSGKTMAFLMPALSRLDYAMDPETAESQGPGCVIVVPTRELGVQIVMLVFKLFGGSVNAGIPGESSNMFSYTGPRGLKVRGVVLPEEVDAGAREGYLRGVHVVVGTPQLLSQALSRWPSDQAGLFDNARVVVVDEVDECFKVAPAQMQLLMEATAAARGNVEGQGNSWATRSGLKPQTVFVGATVEREIADTAVSRQWIQDPVIVDVGESKLPSGLQHRYILVDEDRKLATMARQMRLDLKQQNVDSAPARVMVFARSQDEAQALASPLRNVLWGDHTISVLLPEGEDPIRALHSFRDNKSSLLLATPGAARGLDLPAVTHVYNVDVPEDVVGYLHRAGRAGRIGSTVPAVVTTLVTEQQLGALLHMARELNIDLQRQPDPPLEVVTPEVIEGDLQESDMDKVKRGLEDLYNLY